MGTRYRGRLYEDEVTQGAVRRVMQRRWGVLTNALALHQLSRHCAHDHHHHAIDDNRRRGRLFALEYARIAHRQKPPGAIRFQECWGDSLSLAMHQAGALVADPVSHFADLGSTRAQITPALLDRQLNMLHFWIPEGDKPGHPVPPVGSQPPDGRSRPRRGLGHPVTTLAGPSVDVEGPVLVEDRGESAMDRRPTAERVRVKHL